MQKFEIAEVSWVQGLTRGDSATACTRLPTYLYTSGTSVAALSGITKITQAPMQLFGVYFHCEAAISTGCSVLLDHPSGTTWDTILSSTKLSLEKDASYIPTAPLIIPKTFGVKAWMQAPKTTGATRHITIVVGF